MPLLEARGLTRHFGGLPAVDGVDLDVTDGEVLAVIGPNGAGKSTLLRLVSGVLTPTTGTVVFDGHDVTGLRPDQIRRAGIAEVAQTPRVFGSMSIRDNTALGAMFGGSEGRRVEAEALAIADEVLDLVGLTPHVALAADQLTLHQRRTLELARALAGRPRLLLLDEVMAGLNESELAASLAILRRARAALGVTLLWVEHVVRAVAALADRVLVLDFGRRLACGAPRDVLSDPAVVAAYLGRTGVGDAAG